MNTAIKMNVAFKVEEEIVDDAVALKVPSFSHKGIPMYVQQLAAAAILLLCSPLLLLVALLIKLESNGPILFSQTRVGEFGRQFSCYKLRSMHVPGSAKYVAPQTQSSDRDGICKKFYNDPRITMVGKFIRKFSIDELPQLLNVLKGDMALVGPRPHLVSEYREYDRNVMPRTFCKPGLTGLWQVSGRADTSFDEQLDMDKFYIEQQSAAMDIKILLMTIPAVLTAKGAY